MKTGIVHLDIDLPKPVKNVELFEIRVIHNDGLARHHGVAVFSRKNSEDDD